jgi:signal-transduction protein with cAMP-binding, CBS, and nucleotidyltransferase domain
MIPIAMPMLISQALGRVPTETVERDTFLLACAVHGLITADNIEQFTGTKPVYVPAKAHKSNLLQQIQAGTQKIEASVSRLLDMDGNVSAYTEAIVDVSAAAVHRWWRLTPIH